jgi:antitoxin HicB
MIFHCQIIEQDGIHYVDFPNMPNVITYGETFPEALINAHEALNGVLEAEILGGYKEQSQNLKNGLTYYPVQVEPHIELALLLRRLRGNKPQKDIAVKLGLTYQAYQRLENPRKANPTIKMLNRLAKAYGKTLKISIE